MIYTLTTNPAIDMNITTVGLKPMTVNRTNETLYTPNGKGLNVSFVLGHYSVASKILGFFGGFTGEFIVEESQRNGFEILPTWIEANTRINIFINDGLYEYKLVNEGPYVALEHQQTLLQILKDAPDMDCLTINGSLPLGVTPQYYHEILAVCMKKGVKVILDISSPALKDLLQYHPYLIKPNEEEVKEIFGIKIYDEPDVIDVLDYLYNLGAQNILLTMGEKGAYFYNGIHVYHASAVPIKLVSSACAGDGALGGFLSIWLDDHDQIEAALKRSTATGANIAESNGLGDFKHVAKYIEDIQIRRVK